MLDPIKTFVSLLALVDPLGAVPIFITLTAGLNVNTTAHIARITALSVPCLIAVSALIGGWIIETMGISLGAFKIGGGIVLLLMAIEMLQDKPDNNLTLVIPPVLNAEKKSGNIAVVPLALPILVGPSTISTVIIYSAKITTFIDYLIIILSGVIIGLFTWIAFKTAPTISRLMGATGISITTRVMGFLLTALSAEFIIDGLILMLGKHI